MAKELPYFKFYPSEWVMGRVSQENFSIQGLYLTACCHYWHQDCCVNLKSFCKILGKRNVNKLKELDLLTVKDEQICIEFLDEQFSELSHLHKVRVNSGRKGGLSRAKAKTKQPSSIKDKEEDKEEDKDKKENKEKRSAVCYFPDDVILEEVFQEFLKHKTKKDKKKPTEYALKLVLNKLQKLPSNNVKIKCLEMAIERNWSTIFPESLENQNYGGTKPNTEKLTRNQKFQKAYDELSNLDPAEFENPQDW